MQRQQRRPDLRRTLEKVRKGQPHNKPLVSHKGAEWDAIIYTWNADLVLARNAFRGGREISERLHADAWAVDDDLYAALAKRVEDGLDRITQFDIESKSLSAIFDLPWDDLRMTRNDIAHAFQRLSPIEVKAFVAEQLPQLTKLNEMTALCPRPLKSGEPTIIPIFDLEHLRQNLEPLTVKEGARIGRVGCAYIYIAYDEWYFPHVALSGYDDNGAQWTGQFHDARERVGMTFIPDSRTLRGATP